MPALLDAIVDFKLDNRTRDQRDDAARTAYATRIDLVDHLVSTEKTTRDDLRLHVRALVARVLSPGDG